jgi:putative transcriptional regulator
MRSKYHILSVENIKLKIARVQNELSQQELADLCEVTRQTIGLIEKGKYNPTLNLCIKIAKTLNLTLNDLFWDEDKKSKVFCSSMVL